MADQASTSKTGTSRRRTSRTRKSTATARAKSAAAAKSGATLRGTTAEVTKVAANIAATPAEPAAAGFDQFLSMGQEMMSSWFDMWSGNQDTATEAPTAFGPLASMGPQMMTNWLDAWTGGQAGSGATLPGPDAFLAANPMLSAWRDAWTSGGQTDQALPGYEQFASMGQQMMSSWLDAWTGGQTGSGATLPGPDAFFAGNPMLSAWRDAWTSAGQMDQPLPGFEQVAEMGQQMMSGWFDAWSGGQGEQETSATAMPGPAALFEDNPFMTAWRDALSGNLASPVAAMMPGYDPAKTPGGQFMEAWQAYCQDAMQRSVLFWDVLRKRGNIYVEHEEKGKPPVLDFDYEMIMDGRTFERPVNYALLRILPDEGVEEYPNKRPYVVVDPRAGHGPGIGGSKKDSQIGVAMRDGHPAYFVTFFPEPEPGQTIIDVGIAEALFLEEVHRRHPNSKKPAVIGNCQAGWAVAMLSAAAPEIVGPIILNGAPLSYWAGADGKNPMRYSGGLLGGAWLASLASDLGNGKFDGAYLVQNFENLNPANTLWSKLYNLYAKIDTEEDRYLNFEKWWGGFFLMNAEEMHFIVDNLFVGNKLQEGRIKTHDSGTIDLRNIQSPIVVFASGGDNITPPQQALNWIARVYRDETDIKIAGQTIVYLLHENIGHLGIFVSSRVAQKEHTKIVSTMEYIERLPPGLYEMVVMDNDDSVEFGDLVEGEHYVRFYERTIQDILDLGVDSTAEDDFRSVALVSEVNERLYSRFVSPVVQAMTTESSAELLRRTNGKRMEYNTISDLNPFLWWLKPAAELTKQHRKPVSSDNFFLQMEKQNSDLLVSSLNTYRDIRDTMSEIQFRSIYGPSWLESVLFGEAESIVDAERAMSPIERRLREFAREKIIEEASRGGFTEAIARIAMLLFYARGWFDERGLNLSEQVMSTHPKLKHLSPEDVEQVVEAQSFIAQVDPEHAITTLPKLLPDRQERLQVVTLFDTVRSVAGDLEPKEREVAARILTVLEITEDDLVTPEPPADKAPGARKRAAG